MHTHVLLAQQPTTHYGQQIKTMSTTDAKIPNHQNPA